MRARLVLAAAAALIAGGTAIATSASASANVPPTPVTVTVTHENGGVQFHSGMPGQPLWSVTADNGGICYGFSYQMGHCVGVAPVG